MRSVQYPINSLGIYPYLVPLHCKHIGVRDVYLSTLSRKKNEREEGVRWLITCSTFIASAKQVLHS